MLAELVDGRGAEEVQDVGGCGAWVGLCEDDGGFEDGEGSDEELKEAHRKTLAKAIILH